LSSGSPFGCTYFPLFQTSWRLPPSLEAVPLTINIERPRAWFDSTSILVPSSAIGISRALSHCGGWTPVSHHSFRIFQNFSHASSFHFTHLFKSCLTPKCCHDAAERKASQAAGSRQGEKRVFYKHRPCIHNTKSASRSILLQKTGRTKWILQCRSLSS
jgi:hypothetical protein